jgi:hypothetical protein
MELKKWLQDENGQATTEYILMVTTSIMAAVLVSRKLIGPYYERLNAMVVKSIENQLFNTDLHVFRVKR